MWGNKLLQWCHLVTECKVMRIAFWIVKRDVLGTVSNCDTVPYTVVREVNWSLILCWSITALLQFSLAQAETVETLQTFTSRLCPHTLSQSATVDFFVLCYVVLRNEAYRLQLVSTVWDHCGTITAWLIHRTHSCPAN